MIKSKKQSLSNEDALIITHGDKFITHCIFRKVAMEQGSITDISRIEAVANKIIQDLPKAFKRSALTYPATAFKNQKTQESLRNTILN